ncbi:hypothetical protein E3N88_36660 [Mikania micrantha]|uniref:Protein SCAR n=1 Tax=Mikania micrantha TaxID=192012 RepID=A0A5N6M4A5_9ASTR|nr:hypothetical protein E3N88_36660 [Mikania micrantha]
MPLMRVEVRNEYGLGMPNLYTETDTENPKAVLDGVTVAGLVGILRQLGDLAEFAVEIFHGLQEQVLVTSSRSHKLVERLHNIESALPQIEKAILGQRSHLHFAYTAGSKWHTQLGTEQNHFIYSDLPCCIMDSYENCYDPPCLHNLDKYEFPKKRSSLRNRDVAYGSPLIMHDGRTDFNSSNLKKKASPSQEFSTIHGPLKFGITPEIDHLTSFDSKNGSASQYEENNVEELSSVSHVKRDSYLDSPSLDDKFNDSCFAEDSRSESNYITWDEKLEIIDSIGRLNEPTERPCTTEKMDSEVMEDLDSRIVDRIDSDLHNEQPYLTPVIIRGQLDEIESEINYNMDALKTVGLEPDIDLYCHTKRELKQNSNVNNKDVDEMNKENNLDDNSMNLEFHVLKPASLSHKSISNESYMEANGSSNIKNHEDVMKSDTPEKLKSEEVERNVTITESVFSFMEPISQPLLRELISTCESPKPSCSTSGGQTTVSNPVMFWTNGGLLGLEPSKPPDFGLTAVAGSDPGEKINTNEIQNSGQQNTNNDIKPEASSKMTRGTDFIVPKNDTLNSSRMYKVHNRLLVNGFRKQISLVGNERLASSVISDVPGNTSIQKGYQTVTGIPFKEKFESGTTFISPSSPPLEQMRISFQPIDGFETSKLKLAFPDGNNNGSNGLMFPSFQLVPEPAFLLHEFASDTDDDDDDTFCRSSPYASDDCHSNQSESNSEQWDSNDSPRIKDHELDDGFRRTSSAESVSGSLFHGIRFPEHQNYGHQSSFDNPNFDSMKASQIQVTNDLDGPTEPPPPLPPIEWRGIKPNPCVTIEKDDSLSEVLTYALNMTPPEATLPQPFKPAPPKQGNVVETNCLTPKQKQPDWENLHSQNGYILNSKVEEKDDFLQQIRTTLRNLRPISTAQPTTLAGPNSIKVTSILEKAHAIGQAVGSDDGEGNWSDT